MSALRVLDTGTRFVPHVYDEQVTELVYAKLPSWHAVACYFDWRRHYAAETLKRQMKNAVRKLSDAVLTDEGWVLPRGPMNPRVIDAGTQMVTAAEVAEQARIDREVMEQQRDHEYAVLAEDMAVFSIQWRAMVTGDPFAFRQRWRASAASEEREAFMARWHGENRPR